MIEVRRTYLSGIGEDTMVVDRELYDDEDIFRGIIVESWRGLRRPPQQENGSRRDL